MWDHATYPSTFLTHLYNVPSSSRSRWSLLDADYGDFRMDRPMDGGSIFLSSSFSFVAQNQPTTWHGVGYLISPAKQPGGYNLTMCGTLEFFFILGLHN